MKSPSPPPAPDPVATANAQGAMNERTAQKQFELNAYNENTPMGTVTWQRQAGGDPFGSFAGQATGDLGSIANEYRTKNLGPQTMEGFRNFVSGGGFNQKDAFLSAIDQYTPTDRWTKTTTLSQEQQRLYDLETQTGIKLGTIAGEQADKVRGILNQPLVLDNEATEGRLFELGRKRLDPRFAEEEEALRTRLLNTGFTQGSEGYDRAMRSFSEGKNDAYNSLMLSGREQAIAELLRERAAPINEITALMSGSQVSLPQGSAAPGATIAPTDYLGAVGLQQAALQNAYNQKSAAARGVTSGLFSLGSSALGGWAQGGFALPKFGGGTPALGSGGAP